MTTKPAPWTPGDGNAATFLLRVEDLPTKPLDPTGSSTSRPLTDGLESIRFGHLPTGPLNAGAQEKKRQRNLG